MFIFIEHWQKFKSYDYDGAIEDFSKLIELKPNEGYFFQ